MLSTCLWLSENVLIWNAKCMNERVLSRVVSMTALSFIYIFSAFINDDIPRLISSVWVLYIFVVVNFDALAQASDFQIERKQLVFLCWMQDSNPEGLWNSMSNRLNARWQTDWAIEDQAKNWTRQPVPMISKHSAHSTPLPFGIHTWLWRYTYLLLLLSMLWPRQAIFESKGDKLSSSAECRIRPGGSV